MAESSNSINQKCLKSLEEADLESRIAVVGSGPSYPVSIPIDQLKKDLSLACGLDNDLNLPFWELAELAYQNNSKAYLQALEKCYGSPHNLQARLYDCIVDTGFKSIVTLNYDDQLPYAFNRKNRDPSNFSVYPPKRENIAFFSPAELIHGSFKLLAIHGYADPTWDNWSHNLILRTGDYEKHYLGRIRHSNSQTEIRHAPLFEWWKNLLLSVPCIFIGTTLNEPGISAVVKHIYTSQSDRLNELNHIHLLPGQESDFSNRKPDPSLKCINKIFYDPIEEDHRGLLRIFSALSGMQLPTQPSKIELPTNLSNPSPEDFE